MSGKVKNVVAVRHAVLIGLAAALPAGAIRKAQVDAILAELEPYLEKESDAARVVGRVMGWLAVGIVVGLLAWAGVAVWSEVLGL